MLRNLIDEKLQIQEAAENEVTVEPKEVTDALSIDVTGGEQDCEFTAWETMIGMRAVDVVQPDVMYLGGMLRTLHVCRMAEKAGLPVTPHAANLSLVTMCTMHLLRAIPNAGNITVKPVQKCVPRRKPLWKRV